MRFKNTMIMNRLVLVACCVLLLLVVNDSYAGSCNPAITLYMQKDPVRYAYEASTIVFVGGVRSLTKTVYEDIEGKGIVRQIVGLDVGYFLKGDLSNKKVDVLSEAGGCSCRFDFLLGQEYLLFATYDEDRKAYLSYYCQLFKNINQDDASEYISRIKSFL